MEARGWEINTHPWAAIQPNLSPLLMAESTEKMDLTHLDDFLKCDGKVVDVLFIEGDPDVKPAAVAKEDRREVQFFDGKTKKQVDQRKKKKRKSNQQASLVTPQRHPKRLTRQTARDGEESDDERRLRGSIIWKLIQAQKKDGGLNQIPTHSVISYSSCEASK
jgi:hypothetical protein